MHIHHDGFFNIFCATDEEIHLNEWISSEQAVLTLYQYHIYSEEAQFHQKDLLSQAS